VTILKAKGKIINLYKTSVLMTYNILMVWMTSKNNSQKRSKMPQNFYHFRKRSQEAWPIWICRTTKRTQSLERLLLGKNTKISSVREFSGISIRTKITIRIKTTKNHQNPLKMS